MIRSFCFSFFIFHSLFFIVEARAQSPVIEYAQDVIDTLSSRTMDGRGYVDSSDYKAATFIQHEFQKLNLQSFTPDYFQPFQTDVNVFTGKMLLKINGEDLIPGKDFLIDASSPSLKGKMKIDLVDFSSGDTSSDAVRLLFNTIKNSDDSRQALMINKNQFSKKQFALIIDSLRNSDYLHARAMLLLDTSKLTWDASFEQASIPQFIIHKPLDVNTRLCIKVNEEALLKKNYLTRNVAAFIKGTTTPDSFIVFTSHYDHLGQMGSDTYFPGANDNASGTSMVLNLARYYTQHPPAYSVAFICFSGEELGLLGSSYYVTHPEFPLDKIRFLVNLDIVGTGDQGIKVVNATGFPKPFDLLVSLNSEHQYLKVVSPRGSAANSDHYPFYMKGVPCFFIYTMGGISAYHDIYDRAETLPLTKYEALFNLLIYFEKSEEGMSTE